MALIFKTSEVVTPSPVKKKEKGFSWDVWYAKNKTRLSEKRAKRYQEDADYRNAALERSRKKREQKKVPPPITDGHTVSFSEAADSLGVSIWVLREWRRKKYFPEPFQRNHQLWFRPFQVHLLHTLAQFFAQHRRVTQALRPQLENAVEMVFANWS